MNKTWEFWTVNDNELRQIARSSGFELTDEEMVSISSMLKDIVERTIVDKWKEIVIQAMKRVKYAKIDNIE